MTILEDLKAGRLVVVPREALTDLCNAVMADISEAKRRLDVDIPKDAPVHPVSAFLTGTALHVGKARASPDHTTALLSLVEGMERERDEAEVEADHFAKLACDDLGKNPPVFWKERALAAEAETAKLTELHRHDRQMWDATRRRAEAAEAKAEALREALAWFGKKKGRSLSFDGRTFCEDDNSDLWTVTEERGARNDREWVVLGSGNTPTEALLNASTAARALTQEPNNG